MTTFTDLVRFGVPLAIGLVAVLMIVFWVSIAVTIR